MATSLNPREDSRRLFLYRALVAIVLLPLGLWAIHLGGAVFSWVIALILGLAAWEYMQLFRACGYQPAGAILIPGVILLTIGRSIDGFASAPWILSLVALASITYHLFAYERGRDQAATDLGITLGGFFYIGWLGAYLISIRELPDGEWCLPSGSRM
jgi:CDP-diglyceride synthetase